MLLRALRLPLARLRSAGVLRLFTSPAFVRPGFASSRVAAPHTPPPPPPPTDEKLQIHWFRAVILPGIVTWLGIRLKQHWDKHPDDDFRTALLYCLPFNNISRAAGWLAHLELPNFLRSPVYGAWASAFGCNLDEMKYPLEHYPNFVSFFSRPLRDGARPIDRSVELTSPVDARLTQFGTVQPDGTLEQIKGSSFALPAFLGTTPVAQPKQRLYYCVLYLAPGDYHRVHSCADWSIKERLHVPGHLLSVSPKFLRTVPNVLSSNERVVLSGAWQHGFFSLTSVGATNVGSIKLVHEPELHTNVQSAAQTRVAVGPLRVQPGDELAHFELGSTVVLVFEAPVDFGFALTPGARIKVGQALGGRGRGWTADADVARQRAREANEAIVKPSL